VDLALEIPLRPFAAFARAHRRKDDRENERKRRNGEKRKE
jgi:hypothetical protein